MLKKLLCAVLFLSLWVTAALGEATPEPLLPSKESAAFVEAMFRAAAGVTAEGEKALRKNMTREEQEARNAQCALYREKTRPWLFLALMPEDEMQSALTPSPTPQATPVPDEGMEPIYTAEDSFAAFHETELGSAFLARLNELGAADAESALALSRRITQEWMAQVDHEKLLDMNEDYVLWMYAPGTQIDYPVVRDEGNDYYLDHLFSRKRNAAGTLFIDYRNLPDLLDPNTIIYGHHMRNDSMFGSLTDYEDQAYFEANPYMLIFSAEEIALLEVFSGYVTDSEDHCYDLAISGEKSMNDFVERAKRKSNFDTTVEVTPGDRMVTLSTCAYAFENARYVVIARIASIWTKPDEWMLLPQ